MAKVKKFEITKIQLIQKRRNLKILSDFSHIKCKQLKSKNNQRVKFENAPESRGTRQTLQ